jgi:hypothetical protein
MMHYLIGVRTYMNIWNGKIINQLLKRIRKNPFFIFRGDKNHNLELFIRARSKKN